MFDSRENKYLFNEIYIDEAKNKIVGSDIKSYLNDKTFKKTKEIIQDFLLIVPL